MDLAHIDANIKRHVTVKSAADTRCSSYQASSAPPYLTWTERVEMNIW